MQNHFEQHLVASRVSKLGVDKRQAFHDEERQKAIVGLSQRPRQFQLSIGP
jgi:hypothetical protein